MPGILNMGSINIDYVYELPHFVRAGETLSAFSRQLFPGGKGLNQSIAMARAGSKVYHAGMVGSDGAYLLEVLRDAGVDISLIAESESASGHAIIQVSPEGENCIFVYPGANRDLDESFVDKALAGFKKGDILVLQNEVSCVPYAISAAKEKGLRLAFNPSPFGLEIKEYPLELVDYWLLNEHEGEALAGVAGVKTKRPADILKNMADLFPDSHIVLTLGEEGLLCYAEGEVYSQDSYKVDVVDTTAAGDTFSGYFISAIAGGKDIRQALETASRAASISISRQGAAVSIPFLAEVLERK